MPDSKDKPSGIEFVYAQRISPFDTRALGVKPDPTKERRFVSQKMAERRVHANGYKPVTKDDGKTEIRAEGMILMERPRELAEKSAKYKEQLTKARSQAVRSQLDEEAERLSEKHGRNLHKYFYDDGSN